MSINFNLNTPYRAAFYYEKCENQGKWEIYKKIARMPSSLLGRSEEFTEGADLCGEDANVHLTQKSKGYWKCISRKLDLLTKGYFYTFQTNEEYKPNGAWNNDRLYSQLFPAVQGHPQNDFYFRSTVQIKVFANEHSAFGQGVNPTPKGMASPFMQSLGYDYDATNRQMILPDATVLQDRWEKVRIEYPELPSFEFRSLQGVEDDRTFVLAFLNRQLVLSSDEEFIHDHLVHVLSRINILSYYLGLKREGLNSYWDQLVSVMEAYKIKINKFQNSIDSLLLTCSEEEKKEVAVLQTLLSISVDLATSLATWQQLKIHYDKLLTINFVRFLRQNSNWNAYLQKQHGNTWDNNFVIEKMWMTLVRDSID